MNELKATFNRPADTTAYASGDLVANDTVAGNVVPMQFTGASHMAIRRARIMKSGTGVGGASFRIHIYDLPPTPANGDNGAWLTNGLAPNYQGFIDVTVDKVFTDGAGGQGAPTVGQEITIQDPGDQVIYALLEARGAYTPASGETFTVFLELEQFE